METITDNNMNSIADEIYNQSRLLTTNLRAKGISDIDASMGLNTLINKVLLINPETPTTTTLETRITHNLENGYGINKPFNINGKLLVINTTNNTLIGYLQNTPIQIYDGNNLIGTCITDNQGEYNLTFTPKNTGTINLKIVFEGNQYYESSSTNTIPINIYNYNNITLTITDTILSYENDDTTTLTAQIQLNGNNIQQENILVKFYESDDDCLIGESYTDSNGLATYTYESQGKGDLKIHAKIDNITSNTVNIEDCIYYNPNTISSTQTLNITKNIPTNFKTEYIAKLNSRTVWVEIGADNNNCLLFGSTGDSGKQLGEYVRVEGSYEIYKEISCLPNTSENSIVYTYYNGEQTVTSNDNTTRLNSSTIIDRTYLATHVESGYIKELKIKPYSPKTEYGLSAYLPSNVISYNDDESCTIDVQLMKNNYLYKKSGETVELNLINNKGEILSTEDTQITDEDGQCTLTYDSKGYGDIQLRIDYNDTSIIYDIEDCVKYDSMLSESGKWSFDNGLTPTYSSDGMFLGNVSSGKTAKLDGSYNFPLTVDFDVISITTGSSNSIAFEFKQTHEDSNALFISTGLGIVLNGNTLNTGISQSSYTGHYQLKFTSATNCELYKDNTLITSVNDISVSNLQFMVWLSSSRSITIKNLKIKELNNIQLSNTKDILSYKDNDSTTITAVVDNPVCIDKPIVFTVTDKNDDIVDIYSTILDDTGIVDYTYNSQGKGDLTVTVESMFLKETYKITDGLIYDDGSNDKTSVYTKFNNPVLTYDGTNKRYTLKKSNGGWGFVTPLTTPINTDENISIEATFNNIGMFGAIGLYKTNSIHLPITYYSSSTEIGMYGYGSTNNWIIPLSATNTNTPLKLKYELKDGLISVYVYDNNNILKWSSTDVSIPSTFNNSDIYLVVSIPDHSSSSNSINFKDVLIKPL